MARRSVGSLVLVATLLVSAVQPASAALDGTPPVGTVSVVHDDRANSLVRLAVPATDDLSDVTSVDVSGDGVTWASYPYSPQLDWPAFDPASGGNAALGRRTIRVRWHDGAGNTSAPVVTTLDLLENFAIEYPLAPVTGQPFKIRPIYKPGETPSGDDDCSFELRWGNVEALRYNHFNETFGSLFIGGPADRGYCTSWTLQLPWVPVPQFQLATNSPFGGIDTSWEAMPRIYPAPGSTDPRIHTSNLPLVQILPDQYTIVVGEPITYRAYPIGTSIRSGDMWAAYGPNGPLKTQAGGTTFTITPNAPGTWLIAWSGRFRPYLVGAAYDPPARYRDLYRPNTTTPVQSIGTGTPGPMVPATINWSGTDKGWGIAKYQLQRSTDGGGWNTAPLPMAKSTSLTQLLAPGHSFRYRVRAVDKYGNVGDWDYGPTFKPRLVSDMDPGISYSTGWAVTADPPAVGGRVHAASNAGATAVFSFVGRDVAWFASKGPRMGRAKVYVDGVLLTTVDLWAASEESRRIVYRRHWASGAAHVLRIVVEGTAIHPVVTVDGFTTLR